MSKYEQEMCKSITSLAKAIEKLVKLIEKNART